MAWSVSGVRVPGGDGPAELWIDDSGRLAESPLRGAEQLPGRYVMSGLVDAHAHPFVRSTDVGPGLATPEQAREVLAGWAADGVCIVRDVGSPGGAALTFPPEPGLPRLRAAGRFLAPEGRYFPGLLPEPAPAELLTELALAELGRGSAWVKVIADFPHVAAGEITGASEVTYDTDVLAGLIAAVHDAGGRVAAHCVTPLVATLVDLGVDSIEHGVGVDEDVLEAMARTGAAWTPTLSALTSLADDAPGDLSHPVSAFLHRLGELLPLARRLGVPVLAGTDTAGTLVGEVGLLAKYGLDPLAAIEAATTSAYRFLGESVDEIGQLVTLATYDDDPREDIAVLARPVAVLIDGVRVR